MEKEKLVQLIDEILDKYYWSEIDGISQFSSFESDAQEKELDKEINYYKSKIRELIAM